MEHQTDFTSSPFDTIRREDEQGNEYWSARELYKILGYTEWRHFNNTVIKRARKACAENGQGVSEHFVDTYKMSSTGQGGKRKTADVHLSRYACYLTVMNGDPNMPVVAMGQTYFASQTRRQELADQIAALPEDQRRIVYRSDMSVRNRVLNDAAKGAGVTSPGDLPHSQITDIVASMVAKRRMTFMPAKGWLQKNTSLISWVVKNWLTISLELLRLMQN